MDQYTNSHGVGCPWHKVAETYGAPNIKWCEETLCQWVSEPANTWSNLGYIFVATAILYLTYKRKESRELKQYGWIVLFLGAMSLFFHLSNFYISQLLDFVGMLLLLSWILAQNLIHLGILSRSSAFKFFLFISALSTAVVHAMYVFGLKFQIVILIGAFAGLLTAIMTMRFIQINYKYLLIGAAAFVGAFVFSVLDGTRTWCEPTHHSWFSQGHAIWHWLSAVGTLFIYLHYSQKELDLNPLTDPQ